MPWVGILCVRPCEHNSQPLKGPSSARCTDPQRQTRRPQWLVLKRSRTVPDCHHCRRRGWGWGLGHSPGSLACGTHRLLQPPPGGPTLQGWAELALSSQEDAGYPGAEGSLGTTEGSRTLCCPVLWDSTSSWSGEAVPSQACLRPEVCLPLALATGHLLSTSPGDFGSIFQAQTKSELGRGGIPPKGKKALLSLGLCLSPQARWPKVYITHQGLGGTSSFGARVTGEGRLD